MIYKEKKTIFISTCQFEHFIYRITAHKYASWFFIEKQNNYNKINLNYVHASAGKKNKYVTKFQICISYDEL